MSLRIEHKDGRKVEIGVMRIPRRKNKALISFRGTNVYVLGYFLNDKSAKKFEEMIDTIVDICN